MNITRWMGRGYWAEEDGAGLTDAGAVVSETADAPEGATADKELLEAGLEAMDAEFGEKAPPDDSPADAEAGGKEPEKTPAPAAATPAEPAALVEGAPNTYKSTTGKLVDTLKAPSGWAAEQQLGFEQLPEKVRAAIHQREDAFHQGLETYKSEAHFGAGVRNAVAPFLGQIQAAQVTPEVAIAYLFDVNARLTTGSVESRVATFKQLMQTSGIPLEALGAAASEPEYVDPAVLALREELNQVRFKQAQQEQASQQATRARAEKELDSFIAAHPDSGQLMEDILPYLKSGLTLQQAYDKAVWANPTTRTLRIEAEAKAKLASDVKAAEEKVAAAAKASKVNVKSNPKRSGPTAPLGSIDDTMKEVYAKMSSN